MCGICGVLHLDPSRQVEPSTLDRMVAAMRHRGPDGEGRHIDRNVGLGHLRLSIIDLSDAGRQPMTNEDGRYWIALNGEIYNYVELRAELAARGHQFRSQTDTEVILHLFEEQGPRAVESLNGMFAFIVWDSVERTLFAACDRFGIKPLYVAITSDAVVLASEIKALLRSGAVAPALNLAALADYLTFQFAIGGKTLFRGIDQLQPGHWLRVDAGGRVQIEQYWDVDFTVDEHATEQRSHERLDWLLKDAIRLQLRSDVPVGAHLSGGLDSTTVTALAAARGGAFHTFSGGFREPAGFDETAFARTAAAASGTCHHEVFPTPTDFVELMPSLACAMDEPAGGPGVFPQFMVSRLAREHVRVVLGGQGGDEVFGGYTRYLIAYLEACIKGGIDGSQEDARYVVTFESILPNLPQLRGYEPLLRRFWNAGVFEPPEQRYFRLIDRGATLRRLIAPDLLSAIDAQHDVFDEFRALFDDPHCHALINKMTRFDLKTLLPALLHVEDRTSMAVSLESRVPLLDHRIVELVAAMPPKIKFKGGRSKHIFREVVRPLVPAPIYARTDKMGFPVPLTEWMRGGPVRDFVFDTLLGAPARTRGIFGGDEVEAVVARGEPEYGRDVWALLSLELWFETFLDQAVPGTAC